MYSRRYFMEICSKSCTLVAVFRNSCTFVENPVLSSLFVENNALLQKFMCSCSYALLFTSWCSILDPNLGQNLAQNWTPIWVHPKIHWKIESRKQVSFWNPNLCQNPAPIGTPNCPPRICRKHWNCKNRPSQKGSLSKPLWDRPDKIWRSKCATVIENTLQNYPTASQKGSQNCTLQSEVFRQMGDILAPPGVHFGILNLSQNRVHRTGPK